MDNTFSNFEVVTFAVYLLGGESHYVDTEDVAVKANEIAPGRFAWRKYQDQINIEIVRTALSDAKKPKNGGYILGLHSKGWLLSEKGLQFSRDRIAELKNADLSRIPLSKTQRIWRNREKTRMLATTAFEKFSSDDVGTITEQEAEAFFRVDDYVTGKARERRLTRIVNTFGDDPDVGHLIRTLAKKVRKK